MFTKVSTLLGLLLLAGALTLSQGEEFPQCANVAAETFVMAIEDCASYIYCNGEDSFRDSCPDQTYFDDKAQECAFDDAGFCLRGAATALALEETVPGVQPEESTTAQVLSTTTAPTGAPSTPAPEARPHCNASSDSFHAHPQRCEYYYRCLSGYLTIVRCPYKFGWDYAKQQCQPLSQAQCYQSL